MEQVSESFQSSPLVIPPLNYSAKSRTQQQTLGLGSSELVHGMEKDLSGYRSTTANHFKPSFRK